MQDRYQYHWFNERVTLVKVGRPALPSYVAGCVWLPAVDYIWSYRSRESNAGRVGEYERKFPSSLAVCDTRQQSVMEAR